MKRYAILVILLGAFLTDSVAHAQDPAATPAGQRQGARSGGGQRQGATPPAAEQQNPQLDILNVLGVVDRRVRIQQTPTFTVTTAWWTNAALVEKLGLTGVQKSRIESTFEAHRQNVVTNMNQLEKEEAQLAKLLEAESIDRSGIFTQINRVIQARGDLERVNATMTLEMREQLTLAQWTQLQASQPGLRLITTTGTGGLEVQRLPVLVTPVAPGARGGQRNGGAGQQ